MKQGNQQTRHLAARWRVIALAGSLGLAIGTLDAAVQATPDGEMATTQSAASDADELAAKLANPIAAMISVPFQNNFDWGAGPQGDGFQWKMNFQPVIPFHINDCWNLISRAIIPVVSQHDVAGTYLQPSGSQTGLADSTVSLWLSPANPTADGWIWGVGPVFSLPTGTNTLLTSGKWGAGPTAIVLRQDGKLTYGALVNHVWSFAGDGDRASVNNTFLQPFYAYVAGRGITYSINSESSYNWQASQWTVPVNVMVSKLVSIGKVPVQFQLGARYYIEKPADGPEWGLRFAVTILLPN